MVFSHSVFSRVITLSLTDKKYMYSRYLWTPCLPINMTFIGTLSIAPNWFFFSMRSVKLTEHRHRRHHHHQCRRTRPYMPLLFIVTVSINVIFISDVISNVFYHRDHNPHCHSRQPYHHPYFHHCSNRHRHYTLQVWNPHHHRYHHRHHHWKDHPRGHNSINITIVDVVMAVVNVIVAALAPRPSPLCRNHRQRHCQRQRHSSSGL